jgi:hypothetical protein
MPAHPTADEYVADELSDAPLLDQIEARFHLRGRGPKPPAVDGRRLGHGLPPRVIPLTELSAILMHPSCSAQARDAVWRLLVHNSRTGGRTAKAEAVGVALSGLRGRAYWLSKLSSGDVQAALLAEFLDALAKMDVDKPGVLSNLLNTAFSEARKALRKLEPANSGEVSFAPGSALPPAPYGHPDLVLIRAVRAGVLTVDEAELIGGTYLEHRTVDEYAVLTAYTRYRAASRSSLHRRRKAAQERLRDAIESGDLSDPYADVIAEATLTTAIEDTRPRRRP